MMFTLLTISCEMPHSIIVALIGKLTNNTELQEIDVFCMSCLRYFIVSTSVYIYFISLENCTP